MRHRTLSRLGGLCAAAMTLALTGASVALAQVEPPLPDTLSAQAKAAIAENAKQPAPNGMPISAQRAFIDKYQDTFGALQQKKYAVAIEDATVAGVPVRWVRPKTGGRKDNIVLLNLHGGGFITDSGSQTENIPIAALTGIPVVAVRYRLAPEHAYPAFADDALAVYKDLLKTHKASEIGVYGTSAGAILGPILIARIHKEGLAQPAMLGLFSGDPDLTKQGDSLRLLPGGPGAFKMLTSMAFGGKVDDPLVSPALGPVDFFPPTLCLTSGRDFLLSATANFCRQLELAGVEEKLVVFDGLPHAFWSYLDTPESDQAFQIMARFISQHMAGPRR